MRVVPIVEIKRFLERYDPIAEGFEQFAVDWIEETLDRIEDILEATTITTGDETYCGALAYRVDNILEVMRSDATCFQFFVEVQQFLK